MMLAAQEITFSDKLAAVTEIRELKTNELNDYLRQRGMLNRNGKRIVPKQTSEKQLRLQLADAPGWFQDVVLHARRVGHRPTITNKHLSAYSGISVTRLEEFTRISKLPKSVLSMAMDGSLNSAQCLAITAIKNAKRQVQVAQRAFREGLSAAQIKALTKHSE
jgi:hypothetical protein